MRIRQIKPEFYRDKDMAALPWRTRMTYIGLWCIADDAGWFKVDYVEIARELYGFDSWKAREKWVLEDLLLLQAGGEIEVETCGHATVPTLTKHQRFAGETKRVYTIRREHEKQCLPPPPADPRIPPRVPASGNRNGTELGTERFGNSRERDDGEPRLPSFEEIMSGKLKRTTADTLDEEVAELARQGGLH
jgi:hypothetical protein